MSHCVLTYEQLLKRMCQILQVIVYEKCVFAMVYKGNIGGSSDIINLQILMRRRNVFTCSLSI